MSPTVRAAIALLASAAALAASACGASGGSGEPETTVPPVPAIDDAKDIRGADPCALITPEQLAQAGLAGPGAPGQTPEGLPQCEWRGQNGSLLTLTFFLAPGALDTLAGNSEPTTARVRLQGYPALETFTERGQYCQYDIGTAPDQVLIGAFTGGTPDSCTALQDVLAGVLGNLPRHQA